MTIDNTEFSTLIDNFGEACLKAGADASKIPATFDARCALLNAIRELNISRMPDSGCIEPMCACRGGPCAECHEGQAISAAAQAEQAVHDGVNVHGALARLVAAEQGIDSDDFESWWEGWPFADQKNPQTKGAAHHAYRSGRNSNKLPDYFMFVIRNALEAVLINSAMNSFPEVKHMVDDALVLVRDYMDGPEPRSGEKEYEYSLISYTSDFDAWWSSYILKKDRAAIMKHEAKEIFYAGKQ